MRMTGLLMTRGDGMRRMIRVSGSGDEVVEVLFKSEDPEWWMMMLEDVCQAC